MIELNDLKIIDFVREVSPEIHKIKESAPYHLNIIDELHADENAHSRIFAKLLQYKEQGKYPFLELLLHNIGFDLTPAHPIITVEKQRIDVLIKDDNYSLIIENKINNAEDQEKQVEKYFHKVKAYTNPDKIYVLYLTRDGLKKPSKNSVPDYLRAELKDRFKEINYRQHILPWLEELLPLCRVKDAVMVAGVRQYIDYLKGIFLFRKDFEKMNDKLKGLIKEKLGLANTIDAESDKHILDTMKQLDEVNNVLGSIHREYVYDLRKKFLIKLYEKINVNNDWECVTWVNKKATIDDAGKQNFGFRYNKILKKLNDEEFQLSVEIQEYSKFLCGVFTNRDEIYKEKVIKLFEDNEIPYMSTKYWVYIDLNEYDYQGNKIAWNIYDEKWNEFFEKDSDKLVDVFEEQIKRLRNIWDNSTENQ